MLAASIIIKTNKQTKKTMPGKVKPILNTSN